MSPVPPPLAIMAELTHRCPLRCLYCSNPLELLKAGRERDTAFWFALIDEAAAFGVLQLHLSGGEPTLRTDLEGIIARATLRGLYVNLITSAVLLDKTRIIRLAAAGLSHVQISFQGAEAAQADRIGGYQGGHEKKLRAARQVVEAGMSLTVNAVVHRQNLEQLPAMIELAVMLDADRMEVAHVQYHGWALRNRAALMPTRVQFEAADAIVMKRREALRGTMLIDYVTPDYYAAQPKTCMGGWGQKTLNVTPDGRALPCHAAETIPGLRFERIGETPLREIWQSGDAFEKFRGTSWMREPCVSCARREEDWGGCRCQAMAILGSAHATDPVCALSPAHAAMTEMARQEADANASDFVYRQI